MTSTGDALLERSEVRIRRHADRPHMRYLLPGLVVALAVLPKLFFLRVGVLGVDETILLLYPEQILDGRVPNRDFFTLYGPGNFWLLAGAYSLLGQSFIVERLVGVAYQALIVAGVMGLTRRHGTGPAIAVGVLAAVLLSGPNLLAMSWMGGLALSVWSLALLHLARQRAAFVAGVLAGLAACWRFEMAVMVLAAAPILWRDPRWRRYLTGYVVGAIPLALHLAVAGRATLNNLDRMGLNAQVAPSLLRPSVLALAALLVLAALGLLTFAARRRDRAAASSAIFAALLLPQAFQRVDFVHVVVMTGCVVFPLALAPMFALLRRAAPAGLVALAMVSALLAMCVEAALTPGSAAVRHGGRTLYVAPSFRPTVEELVDAVTKHVKPGSRVFIGSTDMSVPTGTANYLYQLLPEYRNDFYYIELPGGVAERRGSPLVADIESADALILTRHDPNMRALFPHFGSGVEDANQAVERAFCPVERVMDATLWLPC